MCSTDGCDRKVYSRQVCRLHYERAWRAKNRDKRKAARIKWLSKPGNAEKQNQMSLDWARRNPQARAGYNKRRSELERSAAMLVIDKDLRRMLDRYRNRCAYCSTKLERASFDHVLPYVRGGKNSAGNLLPCCSSCNSKKSDRLLIYFKIDSHNR